MRDELADAELRWRKRRLFGRQRRVWLRRLLILILLLAGVVSLAWLSQGGALLAFIVDGL